MKFYKYINTIPDKPIVGGEETEFNPGDTIMVRKGTQANYYWEQYKVAADGLIHFVRGITDDQWGRMERLTDEEISKVESITTGDISKLKEDYSRQEIDQQFNDVRNLANSSRISLNGSTVLPVPPRRPDNTVIEDAWVRLAQNVTYTQAGGDPLTGIEGHETVAEWNNEDGEWSLVDMGELPQVQGVDVINPDGDRIPKEKAVADYVAPFNSVIISSVNLYNPETTLSGGYRLTDGTVTESNNLIRTPILPIYSGQTSISITGAGGVAGAQARIVFVNDLGLPISQTQESINVPFPSNATGFGVTIANEADVGLDPTNNPYRNTLMINYGEPLPYEPYGNAVVNADKLNKIPSLVQTELTDIDTRVQLLENMYTYEYKFPVGQSVDDVFDLTLSDTGDYIEFESRIEDLVSNNQLRMFGTPDNNSANVFGIMYYDFRLRGDVTNEPWIIFDNMPSFAGYHKYKLQVNGSNWDFYIDGVLHQSNPKTSNLRLMTIGDAYTQTLPFWLKNQVSISVGGNVSVFKNFNRYNPNIEESSISKVDITRSNVYVTYQPTGHIGRRKLTVYILRESTGTYIGIDIINQYEPSKNADLYRIHKGDEYEFDGNDMTPTGKEIIAQGESEFTTQMVGKSGHFGGAHGQEVFDIFKIFINGKEESLDEGFSLVPADSFYYIQKSNIVDDNELLTPLMEHYKKTDFSKGSYKTFNRVKCLVNPSLNMQYVYSGIVCISINGEDTATDDYFNSVPVGQSNSTSLVKTGDKTINYYSVLPGIQITSRSIRPEDDTLNTKMWNQNRLSDGLYKYYRVNNDNVQGNIIFNHNDVWEVECEVLFK